MENKLFIQFHGTRDSIDLEERGLIYVNREKITAFRDHLIYAEEIKISVKETLDEIKQKLGV